MPDTPKHPWLRHFLGPACAKRLDKFQQMARGWDYRNKGEALVAETVDLAERYCEYYALTPTPHATVFMSTEGNLILSFLNAEGHEVELEFYPKSVKPHHPIHVFESGPRELELDTTWGDVRIPYPRGTGEFLPTKSSGTYSVEQAMADISRLENAGVIEGGDDGVLFVFLYSDVFKHPVARGDVPGLTRRVNAYCAAALWDTTTAKH